MLLLGQSPGGGFQQGRPSRGCTQEGGRQLGTGRRWASEAQRCHIPRETREARTNRRADAPSTRPEPRACGCSLPGAPLAVGTRSSMQTGPGAISVPRVSSMEMPLGLQRKVKK